MIQVLMATVVFDETGKLVVTSEEEGQPAESETVAVGTLPTLFAEHQNRATEAAAAPTLGSADAVNRLLDGLRKADALQRLVRPQLLTVDGQEATVQAGYREPKITGVSRSPRGQTNSVTLENLGTLVAATPNILPDGRILIELSVETSDFGPETEATVVATSDDGPEIRSPRTDTHMIKTTVSTRDGQTVVVSDQIRARSGKVTETFVLLTAHLID
jgi:type II secretory pathway component GspD/PulD (secretin)